MDNRHQMLLILCYFLLLAAGRTQAEVSQPNITGYTCSRGSSQCHTYAFYRAQALDFLNLKSIGDLFGGVQAATIAIASNLPNTTTYVIDGQSLLVPITCRCREHYWQANITYAIEQGDTFSSLSTRKFENLTTYRALEVANPTLKPTDLQSGQLATIPIRCKCPSKAQAKNGIKMLITYAVHPGDSLLNISRKFGANLQNMKSLNGMNSTLTPYVTVLVPVSQKPMLAQPLLSSPSAPPPHATTLINDTTSEDGSHRGVVTGALVGGAAVLLCIALFVFWMLWKRRQTDSSEDRKPPSDVPIGPSGRENTRNNLLSSISDYIEKPFLYSIEDLQKATQNFNPLCNIEGSVYKGTINGKDYAIKLMKGDVSQELRLLQRVNHANLVKLEGFCISSEGQSVLIYEYVENGSLNTLLHDPESVQNMSAFDWSSSSVPWKTRLQIALDVANGLQYIHEHTDPPVVHKDIKSSNILLDGKFRAKIANFGLAKSGINAVTKHITGTQGYMAPEYLADGFVSPKLDVFAFGVVLLELISGKEAIVREGGVPLAGTAGLLWTQIKPLLEGEEVEGKLRKWVDPNIQNAYTIDSVLGVASIARACVEEDPGERPTLPEIVYNLSILLEAWQGVFESNPAPTLVSGSDFDTLNCLRKTHFKSFFIFQIKYKDRRMLITIFN